MPSSNLDIKMVTITPSVLSAGELCKVELFKYDTYLAADRCYVAENFYGVFVDPAYDNGTGPQALNEGDVAAYEDLDGTLELHVKFTNNGPTAKTFTYAFKVEAAYYPAALSTTTPTPTASSGSFTTVSAATSYQRQGIVAWLRASVTITTNNTAAGAIRVPLPITPKTGTFCTISGVRTSDGKSVIGIVDGSVTYVSIVLYDGTYPGADATTVAISGFYEIAP